MSLKKFKTPKELKEKCDAYFEYADKNDKPYTITGLANWLGTNRMTILRYKRLPKFGVVIKQAKAKCETYIEEGGLKGKLNPAICIFTLKNNYGWQERIENINKSTMALRIKADKKLNKLTDEFILWLKENKT